MEALLGLYYNSKTFKGDNIKNQSFSIAPTKICKGYGDNFKRKETEAFDTACSELEFAGFIMLDKKPQGAIISIKLNKDRIMDAEVFLENSIGFKAKTKIVAELQTFINNAEISNIYVEAYINELCEKIEKNSKSLPDIEEASDIAKILTNLTSVESETYIREYSQQIFGYTKTFEEKYLSKTCSFLLSNFDFIIDDENKKEKVLEEFNILSNPGYVYLKGNIEIVINGTCLDLSQLKGFALCDKDFDNITSVKINDSKMITIENLTSFNRFSEPGFSCIYR